MDIIKIIGVGLVGLILTIILKDIKTELSILAAIVTGIIILGYSATNLSTIFTSFENIITVSKVPKEVYNTVIKIVGIGYLTEFASGLSVDYGSNSIGKKIQFAGKICIFGLALPIINKIFELIISII